jgi:hypothetical protein
MMGLFTVKKQQGPVTAAVEAVSTGVESGQLIRGKAKMKPQPWQAEARAMYDGDLEQIVGIVGEYVDLVADLASLHLPKAKVLNERGAWVTSDDEGLQALVAGWVDADTGFQAPLQRDFVAQKLVSGELVQEQVQVGAAVRFRVLSAVQVHWDQQWTNGEGLKCVLVQLRKDAGQAPRKGVTVEGFWEWHPAGRMDRCWTRSGDWSHTASSPLKRGVPHARMIRALRKKMYRAIDSQLMVNKLILIAPNPDIKSKDDPDAFLDGYYAAADLSRRDNDSLVAQVPFVGRVNDPDKAQLFDLGGEVTEADLAAIRHEEEQFAMAVKVPQYVLIEGSGSGTRNLNNWMLDAALQEQAVRPAVADCFRDVTAYYLRPTIVALQEKGFFPGVDPERVAIGYDPITASIDDAEPEVIFRAYQLGLLPYHEAVGLLGAKGYDFLGNDEAAMYEHWLLTQRLATPTMPAASPAVASLIGGWDRKLELVQATRP